MAKSSWVAVPRRQLPLNAILSFPVRVDGGDTQKIIYTAGSILFEKSPHFQRGAQVYVSKEHIPHLAFYQSPSYWHYAKQPDFDRFVMDYLHSIVYRIFYFKKVDSYTFIALYDFIDRFRFAWKKDMQSEFTRLMQTPSNWHMAFGYRVHVAFIVVLLANRLGYTGFYDLLDFFLGALFADIGHFQPFKDAQRFFSAPAQDWYFDHTHPEISLTMLSDIEDIPKAVLSMVASHHERIDGSGFPKSLKGSVDIPDEAQIVGIVSDFVFKVFFGLSPEKKPTDETTLRTVKNELLKSRPHYSADIFSAFSDLSNKLYP